MFNIDATDAKINGQLSVTSILAIAKEGVQLKIDDLFILYIIINMTDPITASNNPAHANEIIDDSVIIRIIFKVLAVTKAKFLAKTVYLDRKLA
jgi:hypothetical protein